jgi:ribose transport system substrate-binding protein
VYGSVPYDQYKGKSVGILNLAPVPGATRWSEPLKACLTAHGAKVDFVDVGGDITKAGPTIQGWLSSDIKAIFDIGIPVDGQVSLIKQANDKKVPVILWGAGSPPGTVALDANQTVDGVLIAEYVVNKLNGSGKVVILSNSTNPALRQREQGALAVFSQYRGIKVLQKEVTTFSVEGAQKLTAVTLQANPDVGAFIGAYGDFGVGATNAVTQGHSKAIVVSMNGDPEEYAAIGKGGPFKATIADGHEAGSQLACQTGAVMLGGGKPLGSHLFLSSVFVDGSKLPAAGKSNDDARTVDSLGSAS